MIRSSLERALIADTVDLSKQKEIHWRSVIIFLTFSLNPFVFAFGKSIHLSGLIPFLMIMPIVLLMFFFMNTFMIENFNNFSSNLQECYNNYYHRFDKVLNLGLFLYGIFYISTSTSLLMINILSLLRDLGQDDVKFFYIFLYLLILGIFTVLFSISNRISNYFYLGIASIVMWVLGLAGAFLVILEHLSDASTLINCKSFYFSSDFYHVAYIVVVPINITQAFNLIFRDFKENVIDVPRQTCLQSLKYSTIVTVVAYIILGLCLGFTEEMVIHKKNATNDLSITLILMTVYRIFKFFWFSLQIALIMPSIKLAFLGIFYTPDSDMSTARSTLLSIIFTFVAICVSCVTYMYHKLNSDAKIGGKIEECNNNHNLIDVEFSNFYLDLNIKYYLVHYLFLGTSLLGTCVGLLFPWGIMIRSYKYDTVKLALIGFAIFAVISCICLEFIYPQKNPII